MMVGNDATRAGRGRGETARATRAFRGGAGRGPGRQHRSLVVASLCGTSPLIYYLQIKELIYVGNVTQFKYKTK